MKVFEAARKPAASKDFLINGLTRSGTEKLLEEFEKLKCQFGTASWVGRRTAPYVLTALRFLNSKATTL